MEKDRVKYSTTISPVYFTTISVYSKIWRKMSCVLYSCIFQEMEKDRVEYSTHVYSRIWRRIESSILLLYILGYGEG